MTKKKTPAPVATPAVVEPIVQEVAPVVETKVEYATDAEVLSTIFGVTFVPSKGDENV